MPAVLTDQDAQRNIAVNVTRLLETRGWSQSELARKTGDSQVNISRVCRGTNMPGVAFLARIAEAFDVSIDRLVGEPPRLPEKKLRQPA